MANVVTLGCINPAVVPAPFVALEIRAERVVREALESRGCRVRFADISCRPVPDTTELLDGVAGVVLLGGADVDPALYGLPPDQPDVHGVDRVADEFEIATILHAERSGIPVLAICRGAQLLNVAHGGTLIPDIADWAIHHGPTPETIFVAEEVALVADSRLATITGRSTLTVRNGHHQAVDQVGSGLSVSATAADGIVEAIELDADAPAWALGVQWHPEHPDADPEVFSALFDAFVAQMRVGSRSQVS